MVNPTMMWIFGSLTMGALLIAVLAWAVTGFLRANVAVSREEQYRKLAEQAVAAHEASERRMAEIAAELSTMRTHMASLKRVLTEIE
jgi:hypothetical protein